MPTFLAYVRVERVPVFISAQTEEKANRLAEEVVAKRLGITTDEIISESIERCLTAKEVSIA